MRGGTNIYTVSDPGSQQCRMGVLVEMRERRSCKAGTVFLTSTLIVGETLNMPSRAVAVGLALKRTEVLEYNQLPPWRTPEGTCLQLLLASRLYGASRAQLHDAFPMKVMRTRRLLLSDATAMMRREIKQTDLSKKTDLGKQTVLTRKTGLARQADLIKSLKQR